MTESLIDDMAEESGEENQNQNPEEETFDDSLPDDLIAEEEESVNEHPSPQNSEAGSEVDDEENLEALDEDDFDLLEEGGADIKKQREKVRIITFDNNILVILFSRGAPGDRCRNLKGVC